MLNDGDKGAIIQRDRETYGVAPHIPCGVVTPDLLRKLADAAEKHGVKAMKITSAARIAMLGVTEEQIDGIWSDLGLEPGAAVGICVRSVKACPGTTYCKRGTQDSLTVGMELDRKFHGEEMPGKMKLGVSGCLNQCAETNFKDIGIVGTPKGWRIFVGGNGGGKARIGVQVVDRLDTDQMYAAVDAILDYYRTNAKSKERLGRTLERLGVDDLKALLSERFS